MKRRLLGLGQAGRSPSAPFRWATQILAAGVCAGIRGHLRASRMTGYARADGRRYLGRVGRRSRGVQAGK